MSFFSTKIDDVVIEVVDINRATYKEAEEFRKLLDKDIDNGYSKIIVELSNCRFIDSTFLSTIVTALKKVSKTGGNLKLVGVHSEAQALLELTGTVKVFEIYQNRSEAIESFKVRAA